ncbi:Tetratricopeptide repeat-containing protein [Mucilaginibacter mallensis]|uniref:Tetratricopeptide repeat-containing protein n=1 Tax=Mucilaginibacter mallensis TaxID=652787 RepID=A0A1H1Q025_MUCMA|nr:ATP-binding protein [Mucilaginibacter mallensis]SDS16309.1 Tetratricopeptide repeat-containing protein [Mucilaginibacter mallensis]
MEKLLPLLFGLIMALAACKPNPSGTKPAPLPYYTKAISFLDRHNDSAFYYFNKSANLSKDSLQIGVAYNYMAIIQSDAGDYFGAQESLLQSLKYLDTANIKDHSCLASDYNELGLTSFRLRNYDTAIPYFDQAIRFSAIPSYRLIFLNNKALAYQEKGSYTQALPLYQEIIKQVKAPDTYARILTNLATTRWLQTPSFNAAPDLLKALNIRLKENDTWGENSSYSHIANYYTKSRPDSAYFYASRMYQIALRLHSPDDQLIALKKLVEVGPAAKSRTYFSSYIKLNDSIQSERNAAKNQFALIRYNSEKNKSDALRLEKDNVLARYQIIKQQVAIGCIILVVAILGVLLFFWIKKRKRQQTLATQNAVQETQRKASKKVHDTLANDIYRVMKKIQQDKTLGIDWLLDDIEDIYHRARDVSYDLQYGQEENFHQKINELLITFATDETKILLVGNSNELWRKVNTVNRYELKYILQELMVNMQKHSQARNVVVKFEELEGHCRITYIDDGIGMPDSAVRKNGLTNTGNRIKAMKGTFIFGSGPVQGLEIQISFPID